MRIFKTTVPAMTMSSSLVCLALTFSVSSLRGEIIYGLTSQNRLISFDSAAPSTLLNSTAISGLQAGDSLLGLDMRPASGQLFGLGSSRHLYTINPSSGLASLVSVSPFTDTLGGARYGFDFNPGQDKIRLVSTAADNLRLNPTDGTLTARDGMLAYAVGDPNFGLDPRIVGVAYNNNRPGAATVSLFGIDSALDTLVLQNPPSDGVLSTVGLLGVNTTDEVGFDISGLSGTAYASFTGPGEGFSRLFQINVSSGNASLLGTIGGGDPLLGLAASIPEPGTAALLSMGLFTIVYFRRRLK